MKIFEKNQNNKNYLLKNIAFFGFFLLLFFLLINVFPFVDLIYNTKKLDNKVSEAVVKIDNGNYLELENEAYYINKYSERVLKDINFLGIFKVIPSVRENLESASDLVSIAYNYSLFYSNFIEILEDSKLASEKNPNNIDVEKLLSEYSKNSEFFDDFLNKINVSIKLIDENKNLEVNEKIVSAWDKIEQYEKLLINIQNTYFPIFENMSDILGVENTARYLLLFQNNTELRPTGGFIGTYGILELEDAEIKTLKIEDVYNLDKNSDIKIKPPKELERYLEIENLYLRDANWDPDYVKSAKLIETLYKMESEDERNFDGIIALNPVVLENILKIISEIEIDGKVFTASNVIDLLNYETKTGYIEKGYEEDERKKIIEDFSIVLKDKIFNSDLDTVKNISYSILDSLYNKDILLYFENSNIQKIVKDYGFDGSITDTEYDYLSIFDANMLAGKSDFGIERDVNYSVKSSSGKLVSTLSLFYNNNYEADIYKEEVTDVYKSYTRVYVPKGSVLEAVYVDGIAISNEFMDVSLENNKTVFGFYFKLPISENVTYTFEYKLPDKIYDLAYVNNHYGLVLQKQPGVLNREVSVNVNIDKNIETYVKTDFSESIVFEDNFYLNTSLKNDEFVFMKFEESLITKR
ncbi:DUF4012 domain-containing protein [Patescibacteria group bacterium]|nr:DUF4012 domain-containing protein [Patescibacteria group bacterium]